jgi:hypothetical protein
MSGPSASALDRRSVAPRRRPSRRSSRPRGAGVRRAGLCPLDPDRPPPFYPPDRGGPDGSGAVVPRSTGAGAGRSGPAPHGLRRRRAEERGGAALIDAGVSCTRAAVAAEAMVWPARATSRAGGGSAGTPPPVRLMPPGGDCP